jgi:hypothetical protein
MAGPFDVDGTMEFYSCETPGCELHWRATSDYFRFFQGKPFRTVRQVQEETLCPMPGHGHKFIARRKGNKAVWECSVEGCTETEEKLLSPARVWELPEDGSHSVAAAAAPVTADHLQRPLADPGAMKKVPATKKRPGWVWVISIYYTISFVVLGVFTMMILSGLLPMTPQLKAYFANLTALDYLLSIGQPFLSLSAAVALFLLSKKATYLFWASLVVAVASSLWHFAAKGGLAAHGAKPGTSMGALIGFGIQLAVCFYAESLRLRGTLR